MSELPDLLRLIAALAFVLALMGGLALALKKLGLGGVGAGPGAGRGKKRLEVLETLPLDARRRAVLLRRDEAEHLVILGPNGETLIESGIAAVVPKEGEPE
jgi:flagellar protein FliO/FliZ